MMESSSPRSGTHPLLGEAVAPPTAAHDANSINGRERPESSSELQFACTFDLNTPTDCSGGTQSCPCGRQEQGNPLCQDDMDQYSTTQLRAGALPGSASCRC